MPPLDGIQNLASRRTLQWDDTSRPSYRVAVTGDQVHPDGGSIFGDIGLDRLSRAGLDWEVIPVPESLIPAERLRPFDALLLMGDRRVDASSLAGGRLRHVARFGAGYDGVDVDACTRAGVLVTNTAEAVQEPMAHAALTMVLALAHELLAKDRLVRTGEWARRSEYQGRGLTGATVGVVGLGGVGTRIAQTFRALGVAVVVYNRTPRQDVAADLGVRQLPLLEVAEAADYVIVTVAGNAGTVGLVDAAVLGRMKPTAYLVNVARGKVVDEEALIAALRDGRIRGAALDVFAREPLEPGSPLLGMDRVLLTPHSLCWTDAFAHAVAEDAIAAVVDVSQGRRPRSPVNTAVLEAVTDVRPT